MLSLSSWTSAAESMGADGTPTLAVSEALSAVRSRDLGCEGIPMFLALHDARPAPVGDPRRTQGEVLAKQLVAVHSVIERAVDHSPTRAEHHPAAVTEMEWRLAEAVAVVAHAALAEPGVTLARDATAAILDPVPGEPLARMVTALREGRYVAVVNYHNTPASTAAATRAELDRWGRAHCAVRPDDLARLFAEGIWPHPRPPLIPVFYEGYRNNFEVAAPACSEAGLVGWFFLIVGFLDRAPAEQESFAREHEIALAPEELGAGRQPLAMSWRQAGQLGATHVITAHTTHHAAAQTVNDERTSAVEIERAAAAVRRATGAPAIAHAWLFGSDLAHDPRHTRALHRAGYRWVFSNTGIDDVARAAQAPSTTRIVASVRSAGPRTVSPRARASRT